MDDFDRNPREDIDPFGQLAPVEDGPSAAAANRPSFELTEDGIALEFTAKHGRLVRYVQEAGKWLRWADRRWVWDDANLVREWLRQLIRSMSDGEKQVVLAKLRKSATITGAEGMARNDPIHSTLRGDLDTNLMKLGCPGVTVDLETAEALDPDPDDLITRLAAVAPDFKAVPARWIAFLEEATGGDEDLQAFLQVWAGYCLTGRTNEHKLVFLHGEGRNGKSVLLNTLRGILGDYAQSAAAETFTQSRYQSHTTELAVLDGARLVTVSEVTEGLGWNEARIKNLTGGDGVRARLMRQDDFEFIPQFKLILVGNHKPTLKNVDEAMKRRLRFVPFNQRPAAPDDRLEEKLREEWPAILAWAIRGCQQWIADGLPEPGAVREATAEYFNAQDTFGAWLEECTAVEGGLSGAWDRSRDLFASWKGYAEAAGERAGSSKRFGDQLAQRGFERGQERVAGDSMKIWRGLRLNTRGRSYGGL